MIRGRLHRAVAAILMTLLLVSTGTPARSDDHTDPSSEATSPPMFDLFVLRPVGFIALGVGTALFLAPVAPLTLLSRPSDLDKPFVKLVGHPIRYVFADPLGEH